MKLYLVIISLTFIALSATHQIYKRQDKELVAFAQPPAPPNVQLNRTLCEGPYLEPGECKSIKECEPLLSELKRIPNNQDFRRYLRSLNALCGSIEYNVCCQIEKKQGSTKLLYPKKIYEKPKKLLNAGDGCGYTNPTLYKPVSGDANKVGDWPWIALIGYDDGVSISPFRCDGTIITARHVITAAQCLQKDLTFVRVGEYDLGREDESEYMDIKVTKTEKHPDYNPQTGRADIAILYLERNIDFSEMVSPICLPQSEELLTKSYTKYNPFVVGWEKSRNGEKKQILQLHQITIHDNKYCSDIYSQKHRLSSDNNPFDNATVCAGFSIANRDGCQGDAGSPLMMPEVFENHYHFYLIGVAAFSVKCSQPEALVTYTNTRYFIDWIKEKVADP